MTRPLAAILLLCGAAYAGDVYHVRIPALGIDTTVEVEKVETPPPPPPVPDPVPVPSPDPLPKLIEVGPGKSITELSAIDWSRLQDGTTVKVYYRPEPYVAKFVIARSDITIEAMPGPKRPDWPRWEGDPFEFLMPHISGAGAVSHPKLPYIGTSTGHEVRGIICVTGAVKPKGVTIRGFEISGCYESDTFTARDGTIKNYISNAAGVYDERGDDVLVENCEFHHLVHGFFVSTSDTEQTTSRNFRDRNCWVHHCGNATGNADEQCYVEALGYTSENLRITDGRNVGAIGTTGLHDRSGGVKITNPQIDVQGMCCLFNSPTEAGSLAISDPKFHDILIDLGGTGYLKSTGNIGNLLAVRSEVGSNLARRNIVIKGGTLHRVANQPTKFSTVVCGLQFAEQRLLYDGPLFKSEPQTPGAAATQLWLATGGGNAGQIVIANGCREERNAKTASMGACQLGPDADTLITPPDWRQQIPVTVTP